MKFEEFYRKVKQAIDQFGLTDPSLFLSSDRFFSYLTQLADASRENNLTMTSMTILFEGFYRSHADGPLKKSLSQIRLERWGCHYGTPRGSKRKPPKILINH
jgi:hypothetical protein